MNCQLSKNKATQHCDTVAAMLSAVPGLGQLYKGHYAEGFGILMLSLAVMIWFGVLATLAYAAGAVLGFFGVTLVTWIKVLLVPAILGVLVPLLAWMWVAVEAFEEDDRRHRVAVMSQ